MRIPAFYIDGSQAKAPRSRGAKELQESGGGAGITILYSHANAEDLGNIYPWCKFLSKTLGVNVLAYDYTGYGLAYGEGPPSEENCYADIDAAYKYLRETLKVPAQNIVLYGRSLGSGPSCYLASRTADDSENDPSQAPVGGLILHAPFLSVYRIVLETGCTLPGDKFPNVDVCSSIKSPSLLIHGTKDKIVPFNHSEQLMETIPEQYRAKPLFIKGMGHNNVHSIIRPLFVERLKEYMERHVAPNADRAYGRADGDSTVLTHSIPVSREPTTRVTFAPKIRHNLPPPRSKPFCGFDSHLDISQSFGSSAESGVVDLILSEEPQR